MRQIEESIFRAHSYTTTITNRREKHKGSSKRNFSVLRKNERSFHLLIYLGENPKPFQIPKSPHFKLRDLRATPTCSSTLIKTEAELCFATLAPTEY